MTDRNGRSDCSEIRVCPDKDRSTSGCETRPGEPPEEPGSHPPAFGEIRASKRGEAKLQAVAIANSAASKREAVRDGAGRAWVYWAKAAVRVWDSGAACVLEAVMDLPVGVRSG